MTRLVVVDDELHAVPVASSTPMAWSARPLRSTSSNRRPIVRARQLGLP
jgi:hypothetical protein